jgi:hypothetical protein
MSSARRKPAAAASRRRRAGAKGPAKQADDVRAFWGDPGTALSAPERIRRSAEPDAMIRSLGPPPLTGQEPVASQYFAIMYDKAAALAGALAAAADLLDEGEGDDGPEADRDAVGEAG